MGPEDLSGMDLGDLFNQAREFQSKMQDAQSRAADRTVIGEAGGGMVKVECNGKQQILRVEIDKAVIDPDDVDMLQDLVVAAVNAAMEKARLAMSEELGPLGQMLEAGGLKL